MSGEMGLPMRTAYCASKFAVTGFFESLRCELDDTGIFITMACPATVNSDLRKNSLTTDERFKGASSKSAMGVDECAEQIIDAADRRLRKVYFPASSFFGVYLRPFLPDVVDSIAKRKAAVEQQTAKL